jgi:hypothetical protein
VIWKSEVSCIQFALGGLKKKPWEYLNRMASADGVHKYEIRACRNDTEKYMFLGI